MDKIRSIVHGLKLYYQITSLENLKLPPFLQLHPLKPQRQQQKILKIHTKKGMS